MTQGAEVPPVAAGSPPSDGFVILVFAGGEASYKLYAFNVTEATMVSQLFIH